MAQQQTGNHSSQRPSSWEQWVREELGKGLTPLAVAARLVKEHRWPREKAKAFVETHQDAYRPRAVTPPPQLHNQPAYGVAAPDRSRLVNGMLLGGFIFVIGLCVTIGSFLASSSFGGAYVIATGALFAGGLRFFISLMAYIASGRR